MAESVASAKAVLLCLSGRTALRVVVMIVFVTQMLLMMAGDVEPNPGPGEREEGFRERSKDRGRVCFSISSNTFKH